MIFTAPIRHILFMLMAVACFITAGYHVVGIFYKLNDSPPLRHLFFVGVNLFCAYGVLKRPAYFVYLFTILLVQQYYSHGSAAIDMWLNTRQVDWISILVLLFMPLAWFCLIQDYRFKKQGD